MDGRVCFDYLKQNLMNTDLIKRVFQSIECNKNLPKLSQEKWAVEIRKKFGSPEQIVSRFNVSVQSKCELNLRATYTGIAPTLIRFRLTYGTDVAEAWLMAHIMSLFAYDKLHLNDEKMIGYTESIASNILVNYGYLKLTEFMLFCSRFKSGRYGKPYGVLSGREIGNAINLFLRERYVELERIENEIKEENRQKELEEVKKNGLYHDENIFIKTMFNYGYEPSNFTPIEELEKIIKHIENYGKRNKITENEH
jgi:hypothetical protein